MLTPEDIQSEEWMRPYDMNRRADYQTRYSYFPAAPNPIISAINGAAAGLGDAIALTNAKMFTSLQSDDFREGVAHFQERRPPRFTGR